MNNPPGPLTRSLRISDIMTQGKEAAPPATQGTKSPRIVLYALRELHIPVLIPIYNALQKAGMNNTAFMAPPYKEADGSTAPEGISPEGLADLEKKGLPFWGHLASGRYDCIVTADVCHERIDGWGPIVCVGHGTISKNLYFVDSPFVRRESFATALCVPGPWYVDSYGGQVLTHIEPTGFSKLDEMANPASDAREKYLQAAGLEPDKFTILFAPTFNPELTALIMLWPAWEQLSRTDYQVIVKLHGATDENSKNSYRQLCQQLPGFHYAEESSLVPAMTASDLGISDVSSAGVEYLLTGKPVIAVENPQMKTCPFYNPKTVEFQVRDAAYPLSKQEELFPLLKSIRRNDFLAEKRREYAEKLFPPLDGGNSERVARVVHKVCSGKIAFRLPDGIEALEVMIPQGWKNMDVLEENLSRAKFPLRILSSDSELKKIGEHEVQTLAAGQFPHGPFAVFTGDFIFAHDWDLMWALWRQWNPDVSIWAPILESDPGNLYQQHGFFYQEPSFGDPQLVQSTYKLHGYDKRSPVECVLQDGSIFSKTCPRNILQKWWNRMDDMDARLLFARELRASGHTIEVCPGNYGYHMGHRTNHFENHVIA